MDISFNQLIQFYLINTLNLPLNLLFRVIPTKWRSHREHRLCDVTSACVVTRQLTNWVMWTLQHCARPHVTKHSQLTLWCIISSQDYWLQRPTAQAYNRVFTVDKARLRFWVQVLSFGIHIVRFLSRIFATAQAADDPYDQNVVSIRTQTSLHGLSTNPALTISRIHFLNSRGFFTWQAIQYQNAGGVILFIWGLLYVQCTKNRLTCENYIASYKIFQRHQLNSRRFPVYPRAISNSRPIGRLQFSGGG